MKQINSIHFDDFYSSAITFCPTLWLWPYVFKTNYTNLSCASIGVSMCFALISNKQQGILFCIYAFSDPAVSYHTGILFLLGNQLNE